MHTFYKEHKGSYAVAVPWLVRDSGDIGSYQDWHTLFRGLSLQEAMFTVRYLNGGPTAPAIDANFMSRLGECAA